jgi:FlaA1/EpsC-like NDP-sugar epimerase
MLITGASGNIGKAVIEEAQKQYDEIIVFEIDNKKTRKTARKFQNKIKHINSDDIRN